MKLNPSNVSQSLPWLIRAFLAIGLLVTAAGPARADGILGAFIGTTFGGKAFESCGSTQLPTSSSSNCDTSSMVFGGVLGGVRPGAGLGFEIDFGYSPDFFGTEDITGTKTTITTVMGNLVFGGGTRGNGVAPYFSGGVGLIRANIEGPTNLLENLSTNDFGINLGGGINAMISGAFGFRGDIRYFRSFKETDVADLFPGGIDFGDFDFWRASVGALIRW